MGRSRSTREALRPRAAGDDRGPVLLDPEYQPTADPICLDEPYRDLVSETEGPPGPPPYQPLRSFVTLVIIVGQCRNRDEPVRAARRQGDEQAELGDGTDAAAKHLADRSGEKRRAVALDCRALGGSGAPLGHR